jgi:hypothetical protein
MTDMTSDGLPEWRKVRPINGRYHRGSGGWEELFDFGGIRYHGRLFPSTDGKGIQDESLLLLATACEEEDDHDDNREDMIEHYGEECRQLIWPLIEQDYASRSQEEKGDLSPSKEVVRIEGRTIDGELRPFSHTGKLDYSTHPIPNTFSGVPTFLHTLVHRIKRLDTEIFKVKYEGQYYCLKTVHSKEGGTGLQREIIALHRCDHEHIIPIRGIVVNDQNNVEGMLTELVHNPTTLDQVDFSHFSKEQCDLWMSQVRSAINYLHSRGLVWGDAKPANILVRRNHDLVLVDFAGGATAQWVDWKNMNTQEGDLQALVRIEEFLRYKVVNPERNN